jgi:2-polyprenyl-3-methyl-5-hydroxy-6-metoxy-1,4-benzoquinol methylase
MKDIFDLDYALEWRQNLWRPTVRWLLGDVRRFEGMRVLELGCRRGRMTCYFASLGAYCDGADVDSRPLEVAREEADRWNVAERTNFIHVSPDLSELAAEKYDFIFTKSVLIMMGQLDLSLERIASLLKPNGEYLAAENSSGGLLLFLYRQLMWHTRPAASSFSGLNKQSIEQFHKYFQTVTYRSSWRPVLGVRSQYPKLTHD